MILPTILTFPWFLGMFCAVFAVGVAVGYFLRADIAVQVLFGLGVLAVGTTTMVVSANTQGLNPPATAYMIGDLVTSFAAGVLVAPWISTTIIRHHWLWHRFLCPFKKR